MLIDAYGKTFAEDSCSEKTVSEGTVLGQTADEILEMVSCYASDGRVFYKKGDLVNAVASFAYGYGWLDAGRFLGYLAGSPSVPPKIEERLPDSLFEHLSEKTYRYQRMLTSALEDVSPSPDSETVMYAAACSILKTAGSYLARGGVYLPDDLINALIFFSYGYGWLDCGVRAGLFSISGDRHLFTI
ncbi:Protein of unknown function DUF357 [Methanocorpusculum labreanum Z]|uniref:DUF357 domain-containing protein n=1 Tax=Methanocorpusculum labreanum (strain ATCC 43576 / DSM 4855 / Z) TaxID=410358 RepID=A2SQF7_METLZ|nr:DUF357 domain-containing protein [Methanocorpusculum labreanum]ABN06563.1 Protein of unknown function DUF357 [Methanocorpusculum labreanum Z]